MLKSNIIFLNKSAQPIQFFNRRHSGELVHAQNHRFEPRAKVQNSEAEGKRAEGQANGVYFDIFLRDLLDGGQFGRLQPVYRVCEARRLFGGVFLHRDSFHRYV